MSYGAEYAPADCTLRYLEVQTGKMLSLSTKLKCHPALIVLIGSCLLILVGSYACKRVDRPGERIAEGDCNKKNEIGGGCISSFVVHARPAVLSEVAISPSNDVLYALDQKAYDYGAEKGSQLVAWRISDGIEIGRHVLDGYAGSVAIAPAGDKLAAWSMNASAPISVFTLPNVKFLGKTSPISMDYSDVAFSGTGSELSVWPKNGQRLTVKLQEGQLTLTPTLSSSTTCYGNAVGFGFLGEVSSRDGKIAVLMVSGSEHIRRVAPDSSLVRSDDLLKAICNAPWVVLVSVPRNWPDAASMYAVFSPDDKRLAIVYSVPDTRDYGGVVVQVRDLSHLPDEGGAPLMPLIASFPINGAYPDLGWSPDGHRLAVIYETTASRRKRSAQGDHRLTEMQSRIYAIP